MFYEVAKIIMTPAFISSSFGFRIILSGRFGIDCVYTARKNTPETNINRKQY